jgi:hypothetical protein
MELSSELEVLLSTGLNSTQDKVNALRFFRLNRGAVCYPELVSHQGSLLRAQGEGAVGEDYWSILEQTLIASLQCKRVEEAIECLKVLQGRFGAFEAAQPSAIEGEPGTPQSGSLRVHYLELLVREWRAVCGGGESSGGNPTTGGGQQQLARQQGGGKVGEVRAGYEALQEAKPLGGAPAGRRLALLDSLPRNALVKLLGTQLGDSSSWQELGELYASEPGTASLPQAIHCYEELVLLAPNQAGWHARLAELTCAAHVGALSAESATPALRQARLHAAEAVRLSEGAVAYASCALADAAYLLTVATLASCGGASAGERKVTQPREHRLLPGLALRQAVAVLAEAAEATVATALEAPALPASLEKCKPESLGTLEESLALHALACHYLEAQRAGSAAAQWRALAGKAAVDAALCGGKGGGVTWASLFPASAVEGCLLHGKHAAEALRVQCAYLKGVAALLGKM